MRFAKVLGILVLAAVACRAILILLIGQPPGISFGGIISLAAGGGLLIFVLSAVAAGAAAYFSRDREDEYPGLMTGLIVAVAVSMLMLISGG